MRARIGPRTSESVIKNVEIAQGRQNECVLNPNMVQDCPCADLSQDARSNEPADQYAPPIERNIASRDFRRQVSDRWLAEVIGRLVPQEYRNGNRHAGNLRKVRSSPRAGHVFLVDAIRRTICHRGPKMTLFPVVTVVKGAEIERSNRQNRAAEPNFIASLPRFPLICSVELFWREVE